MSSTPREGEENTPEQTSLKELLENDCRTIFEKSTFFNEASRTQKLCFKGNAEESKDMLQENLNGFLVSVSQWFNRSALETFASGKKLTEQERRLTTAEKEAYNFFENIDDFFDKLERLINQIMQLNFRHLQNGVYGNEANSKTAYNLFSSLLSLILDAGGKYDFLTITLERDINISTETESRTADTATQIGELL